MSTDVEITLAGGDPALASWACARIGRLESLWSRFRDDSEITRLNRAGGEPVKVTVETFAAVRAACAAWVFTGGRFDPTVHDSLLRLGYDGDIGAVRGRGAGSPAAGRSAPSPGCTGIVLDEDRSTIALPRGTRLDLGGIGKGLAADDVAVGAVERGAGGAMVNVGGDVRVTGTPSESSCWRVTVEDPRTHETIAAVDLLDGGVATSTTLRRRWQSGASMHHHLVDPRTGSSTAGIVGVSAVAGTAGWADALSKVPFVDPTSWRDVFIEAAALVIDDCGRIECGSPFVIGGRAA